MGGAFIGVADDATAASWNPGGLTQLLLPEISIVGTYTNRKESLDVKTHPEASDQFRISNSDITYFSMAYPFSAGERNMIISITYQQLYDMNRHWTFQYSVIDDYFNMDYLVDYHQKGSLSALGLSYCLEITPDFSLGFTINIWDDDMSDNHWTQIYDNSILNHGDIDEDPTLIKYKKIETYSFNGTNFNLGFLWNINSNFTLGAVLKTSFWADIDHTIHRTNEPSNDINQHEKIKMPLSYGINKFCVFQDGNLRIRN
jgi:long-subunit fatty acid transport protein